MTGGFKLLAADKRLLLSPPLPVSAQLCFASAVRAGQFALELPRGLVHSLVLHVCRCAYASHRAHTHRPTSACTHACPRCNCKRPTFNSQTRGAWLSCCSYGPSTAGTRTCGRPATHACASTPRAPGGPTIHPRNRPARPLKATRLPGTWSRSLHPTGATARAMVAMAVRRTQVRRTLLLELELVEDQAGFTTKFAAVLLCASSMAMRSLASLCTPLMHAVCMSLPLSTTTLSIELKHLVHQVIPSVVTRNPSALAHR